MWIFKSSLEHRDEKKKNIVNKRKISFNLVFYQSVSCKHWQCNPLRQERICSAELFSCRVQTLQGILNVQSLNCLLHGQELSFIRDDTAFTLWISHPLRVVNSFFTFIFALYWEKIAPLNLHSCHRALILANSARVHTHYPANSSSLEIQWMMEVSDVSGRRTATVLPTVPPLPGRMEA